VVEPTYEKVKIKIIL